MTTTDGAAVDDEIVFDVPTRMCIAKLLTIDLGALNGMTNVNGALLQFCFFLRFGECNKCGYLDSREQLEHYACRWRS